MIDELAGDHPRDKARSKLIDLASRMVGETLDDAALVAISGRYEFYNKGIDLFLDSLAKLNDRKGRNVVAFVLVPAGNSGMTNELQNRFGKKLGEISGACGVSTHNLFDAENDPVQKHCTKLGLDNQPGSRVKVIQVPIYLSESDDCLNMPYEAVLRAMDLSAFPSFYEPWGYTPQESLAVGVPTITSDYAGFGRWCNEAGLTAKNGVTVLARVGIDDEEAVNGLDDQLETLLGAEPDASVYDTCRATAQQTAWSDLVENYYEAYGNALASAQDRIERNKKMRSYRRRTVQRPVSVEGARGPRLLNFSVSARLPEELQGLRKLADNYWWCWDPDATSLFEDLSPQRWEACAHNPIRLLREVYREDLEEKARDTAYTEKLTRCVERFERYMDERARAREGSEISLKHPVAYFSAEFAIHESLRIYSGGLGVLAGDHLKSASDVNLPLVGVGLFYRNGYMRQAVTAHGDQIAEDEFNDPRNLPLELMRGQDGKAIEVCINLPSSQVKLQCWKVQIGRVPLYLLDSNVPENRPEDRDITEQLYGGDHENRLRQEIVLGRGGAKVLKKLGIEPSAWHCNEGHAAFLSLERVRGLTKYEGLTFDEAREICRATTVFTTHTPVPAGHDRFGEDLMRRYFSDVSNWVGVPWDRFFALGQADGDQGSFNMTYLAMNFATHINGVSELHGKVSQGLLHSFWNGLLESEVPVAHVTNGIHLPTWTAPKMQALLTRESDAALRSEDFATCTNELADSKVWEVKHEGKRALLGHIEQQIRRGFEQRGDRPALMQQMLDGLDDNALWIGFARRFAPYKRAHLLFSDEARLARILENSDRPVRIVIAGKAHPRDQHGQDILRRVVESTRREPLLGKVFFVENYDIDLARFLVQGVDVWLNTPTRPLEASGDFGNEGLGQRRSQPLDSRWLVVRGLRRRKRLGDR